MVSQLFSTLLVLSGSAFTSAWQNTGSNGNVQFGYVPGNDFGLVQNATYDYVVVGGGTAGLAVAYRLAESGCFTVAVVEAGGFYENENGNQSVVPAYCTHYGDTTPQSANQFPLVDWGFVTQPQEGLGGRRLHYGRGKTLGGSSAQNAMIYNRGTKGSYQAWANLVGDDSWTFDNILPYFSRGIHYSPPNTTLRAANASVPPPANMDAYNVTGGPLEVSHPNYAQIFSSYVNGAMQESGIPEQQDFSSGSLLGRQYAPLTISYPEEERSSSQASYLRTALRSGRDNLKVFPHTLSKRVLFDENKTATGVEFESKSYGNMNTFTLSARREVILSAGAFQSPQLLMVSGIGPRQQLVAHNISVLADRPGVGTNMQDHLDFAPVFYTNIQNGDGADADPATRGPIEEEYKANRTGQLTNAGVDYIGWEKLPEPYRQSLSPSAVQDLANYPADWPEIEYEVTGATLAGTDPSKRYGTILAIPVTPLSRGWVNITSADTNDLPLVNPNQLSHPTDRELAVQAFKRARSFFHTQAMQPILIKEYMPGTNVTTDEQILKYIEASAYQNWHASCTCRMGKADDPMAVVDSQARVIGVKGLRVADASSFALLPPGHPESTVYMLAEKISADILETAMET
ncbi:alcohol oxidase [Lecanosticta acicola]|uniref:Alcohol oxidase n=1 Tax=Lecanosticta acicola TaxID=111012 RepID=A0AAI8YRL0_9PEZI|nr:alcohol oxidase [Lecanosticta acicola]